MNAAENSTLSLSVKNLFNSITDRYDFLNSFLSCGLDRGWRREMVNSMRFFNTNRYLDLATGTADIAVRCAKQYPGVSVLATDFALSMLDCARIKIGQHGLQERISIAPSDACSLNVKDNSFDCSGMAFGIRNIPDKLQALKEMKRVTVPGGMVLILELTRPSLFLIKRLYQLYLCSIMPAIARLFTSQGSAYDYLADSIIRFPDAATFTALMRDAGFSRVSAKPMTFGTCHLFYGTVEE